MLHMRNIGPRSAKMLKEVGILSREDLETLGAVGAFELLRMRFPDVTLNLLWSLHAGLMNRDWRSLDETEKQLLLSKLPK